MKKLLIPILALIFCMGIMLTGCGGDNEEPAGDSGNGESETILNVDESAQYGDVCSLTIKSAEVLDDKAVQDGWYYYYTDTLDNPAPVLKWEVSEGNYTSIRLSIEVENLSDEEIAFSDIMNAQLFYAETMESDTVYYDGTIMQRNPGQLDKDGYEIASTEGTGIAPGEKTTIDMIFDIPEDVYKTVYDTADGESTGIIEKVEFNFGDGNVYIINLVSNLVLASRN